MTALPAWLTRNESGAYIVDPDGVYPEVLELLNLGDVDQYALEVTYQCVKLKAQELAAANGDGPESGKTLALIVESGKDKAKWAIASHPAGRGVEAATKGREARAHYERIRARF